MKFDVLDHGYVELVETWGSDERIIEAARMSTAKGFQGWGPTTCVCFGPYRDNADPNCTKCKGTGEIAGDEKLLRFLWEHKHATPFEMAGLTIEVQAPIMVFREWHRHRSQSFNEMSGRYTVLPSLFYLPDLLRLENAKQSQTNKQSSEAGFTHREAQEIQWMIESAYASARIAYEKLLTLGVAKEVARLVLPVAQYSKMRASANLRNWLAFLTLRLPGNAQFEIRQYANAVASIVEARFPRTYELFREGL